MYEPEVDDYVIWERECWNGEHVDEGWVYFKGDQVDNTQRIKEGWKPTERYITIETGIRLKPTHSVGKNDAHKYIHTLLLCYESQLKDLKLIKKRKHKEVQHYSEYDDVSGNET